MKALKIGGLARSFARGSAALGLVFAALAGGCSSKTTAAPVDAGPPPCDPTKCLAGNQCINDGTSVECRLVCTSQAGCPFNYHCTPNIDGMVNFCATDKDPIQETDGGAGQWGASCVPSKGIDNNPSCDFAQGFRCYAKTPTDGAAFCTQFLCTDDSDCKGGWWCAAVNDSPNALTTKRSTGATINVCLPREYCAPCQTDIDCPATSDGITQHCILDKNQTFYCAPECSQDSNCNNEARCVTLDQSAVCNAKNAPCVCAARAQECVGDGQLCSPCLSDKDCKNGLCIPADYSTEHFCTVKSTIPCTVNASNMLVAGCPMTDEANGMIGCTTEADSNIAPKDQCVGFVEKGSEQGMPEYVLGCFTPNQR